MMDGQNDVASEWRQKREVELVSLKAGHEAQHQSLRVGLVWGTVSFPCGAHE